MMVLKSIGQYFLKHWRGELSLATSFWINIVALNLLVLGIIDPFINYYPIIDLTFELSWSADPLGLLFPDSPVPYARIFFIWSAFQLVILYPWQFIGLMRSCSRYMVEKDKKFWARTAKLLAIIGIVGVVVNTNQLWPEYRDDYHVGFVADLDTDYKVALIKDNTFIHLEGDIGYGVSKDVHKLLMQHSGIKGIILDSGGGLAYEGYELSNLVRIYNLDTYTLKFCMSACTTAFISGEKRYLGIGSFLGFHQSMSHIPSIQNSYTMAGIHKRQKEKNLVLFNMREIDYEFFEKASNAQNDDPWYPSVNELIEAGVVHEIINPYDLIPSYKIFIGFRLDENLRVHEVFPASFAERMRFQKDDILIQWDEVKLDSYDDYSDKKEKFKIGDPYHIKIRRNKSVLELEGILH